MKNIWIVYNNYYDGLDRHQSTIGACLTEQDAVRMATTYLLINKLLPNEENLLVLPNGKDDDDYGFWETEVVVCPVDDSGVLKDIDQPAQMALSAG